MNCGRGRATVIADENYPWEHAAPATYESSIKLYDDMQRNAVRQREKLRARRV